MKTTITILALTFLLFFTSFSHLFAKVEVGKKKKLELYGDMRFRVELDRNSTKSDGSERDNRDRLRFRFRFGFDYKHSDHFSFGGRLRSGSLASSQSPHVTLGNELTPKTIHIDKAYINAKWNSGFIWAGKNSFPFWKQNEMFWDDDVTPEGLAFSQSFKLGKSGIAANGGYFILDNSTSNTFGDQARLLGAQLAFKGKMKGLKIQAGGGIFVFREDTTQVDIRLADLDYTIGVFGANLALKNWPKPVKIGVDFMANLENYDTTEVFNADQTTGYVASIKIGELKNKGDWLLGYYYAHIEEFAVVARYAQDDWVRWGSSTETRSSNFQGHEIRFAYALGSKNNLVARLYLVEGLKLRNAAATSEEDGTRFRIDWNIGF